MESKLNQMINEAMGQIKNMLDVNTVVGEPIIAPDGTMIIPVSKIGFGAGGGGTEWNGDKSGFGGGAGVGGSITPVSFLVITQNGVRVLPMQPGETNTLGRIIDAIPGIVSKAEELIAKYGNK
ncbi:sporulation protein YtfJ [Clostridia bacterium]|nr:sporulation protein YtfJ [Clostridia bacterium]